MSPDVLALVPRHIEQSVVDGSVVRRPVSHYLDLVVNGQSLAERVDAPAGQVTSLNRAWLADVPTAVERLLGRTPTADLTAGRVVLLQCGMDADLACGALTAALCLEARVVTWSDFLWEDGYQEPTATRLTRSFTFERSAYEAVLEDAAAQVRQLRHDAEQHRPRGFLWPWQWGWRLPKSD